MITMNFVGYSHSLDRVRLNDSERGGFSRRNHFRYLDLAHFQVFPGRGIAESLQNFAFLPLYAQSLDNPKSIHQPLDPFRLDQRLPPRPEMSNSDAPPYGSTSKRIRNSQLPFRWSSSCNQRKPLWGALRDRGMTCELGSSIIFHGCNTISEAKSPASLTCSSR